MITEYRSVKVMEIEKITIYNDINPVIQEQLHEHYRAWNANRQKHSVNRGGKGIKGYLKCTNCKKYFPEEDTVIIRFSSGRTTRRCLLCDRTMTANNRTRRRK